MLGEILLGVRPVLARMPEIPCVFWGHGRLNEYDDMMMMISMPKLCRYVYILPGHTWMNQFLKSVDVLQRNRLKPAITSHCPTLY